MDGKTKLYNRIAELEGKIKDLTAEAENAKKDSSLSNEDLENKLKEIEEKSTTAQEELDNLKKISTLYDETKENIEKLQALEELNPRTESDNKEIERLKSEIKRAKEQLGKELTDALENETKKEAKSKEPESDEEKKDGPKKADDSSDNQEEKTEKEDGTNQEKDVDSNVDADYTEEEKKKKSDKEEDKKTAPEEKEQSSSAEESQSYESHVSAYEALIDEQIKKLNKRISKINNLNTLTIAGSVTANAKAKALQKQIDLLNAEKAKIHSGFETDNPLLEVTDEKMSAKDTKIETLQKEIEELKAAKANIKGKFGQKIVEAQMKKKSEKIKALQRGKTRIVGRQKKYLLPKLYLEMFKNRKLANLTGKQEAYAEAVNDLKELSKVQSISSFKRTYYETVQARYEKNYEHTTELLEKLNEHDGAIGVKGSSIKKIPQKAKDAMSQAIQKQSEKGNDRQVALAA